MRIIKKAVVISLLAMILNTLAIVSTYAESAQDLSFTIVDGVEVITISQVADNFNVEVEWDSINQTVNFTDLSESIRSVAIYYVGGFNDGINVWLPLEFVTAFFSNGSLAEVHITDHGELATAFITEMNDNLYNRVSFSYRELEAAEWIVDELLAMGFNESDIVTQSFGISYLEEFEDGFRADWFTEVVNSRANGGELVPEEFIRAWADSIYEQALADFAEAGFTYEMITYDLGMELSEFIETYTVPALEGSFSMYGAFSDEVEFRQYSQNIILTIPGRSEQKIVLTAHYDTVYNTPGASDNASGVALLMESAYRMMDEDNYFTLVYAFVGAEEVGLVGAFYYHDNLSAEQQANILVNINADVLFEGPYFFVGAAQLKEEFVGLSRSELMWYAASGDGLMENDITHEAAQIAKRLNEQYGAKLIVHRELAAMPSDQLVFLINGHTVIALTGLARYGDDAYTGFNFEVSPLTLYNDYFFGASVVHSLYDDVHFINENWPDKIANAMWTFSLLLDTLLAAEF